VTRLLIHVEGQTEETFVNEVLRPHLFSLGFSVVGARLLGNSRTRLKRGGIKSWDVVKQDIHRHLADDRQAYATTMVDYYALPNSWPGRATARLVGHHLRASTIEDAISLDFNNFSEFGQRFVPHIVMHEFEALLFSDCDGFAAGLCHPGIRDRLQAIRDAFESPEHINDSPITAPSKRILSLMPGYEKTLFGPIAALEIGLAKMRAECPNLDKWLKRIEVLPAR
jgi:Domain of unknown function (DUF4276)